MQHIRPFSLTIGLFLLLVSFDVYSQSEKTSYTIDALIDVKNETITVDQELSFINPDPKEKNIIYLQDWSNSFKNTETPLSLRLADEYDRSFYFSDKDKRGYTKINEISLNGIPLVWQRLNGQSDLIKVFLFGKVNSNTPVTLKLKYQIKIPDQKFIGFGIDGNGELKLRNWFIALAPYIQDKWLIQSNLGIDDNSHLGANFNVTWHLPKEYYVESNLEKVKSEMLLNSKKISFSGLNQTRAQFYFTKRNLFKNFDLGQGKLVVTDMLNEQQDSIKYKNSISQIKQFVGTYLSSYPHDKELILQLDYDKNPFYGFNQLPSFLKLFSDQFFFEIKFIKAYLDNYLNEKLTIDKRKDYWLFGGIQSYLMIKYVETYYPDQKFIGNLSEIKLFKNYNFSDLPFNSGYQFFYETVLRSNVQQSDYLSKEAFTKFNYKIGSPYHIGIGLRYLDAYLGEDIVQKSLKEYLSDTSKTTLKDKIATQTNLPIDWFFTFYLKERRAYELKINKVAKVGDRIQISVEEKNKNSLPINLAILKNDSILSSKWVYLNDKPETLSMSHLDGDYLAINPKIELPEQNKNNNWVYLKDKVNFKPLKFQLLKDIENPKYKQLFFTPIMNFNYYDGLTPGIRLINKKLKAQPFKFDIQPQYALREKTMVGQFVTSYRINHDDKKKYLTRFSIFGNMYHYNTNLRYSVFVPSISFFYRNKDLRSNQRQYLNLSLYSVKRDNEPGVVTSPDYDVLNFSYSYSNQGAIRYFTSSSNIEISDKFAKIQSNIDYRKLFPSGRQFGVRLFFGKFLWKQSYQNNFFDFNLNRPNDYLFRYDYLGRSETTGFYSQQFVMAEGGFKSIFEESTSNDYMGTINVFMGLWKWVEVYGDVGFIKNKGKKAIGYFDSGIRLNLVPDYFELYFPLVSSNGWEINQTNYMSKIRFVLSLKSNAIKSLFTRNWF